MRTVAAVIGLCILTLAGCSRGPEHRVTITEGPTVTRFPVKGAFAEYFEVSGQRNELRITLSSYGASCERWVPPAGDDPVALVTVVTPPQVTPTATAYPWPGLPAEVGAGNGEAASAAPHPPAPVAYALPKVLLGKRSRLFQPGGGVTLSRVELDTHGTIAGTLAFEFPGTAEHPATRLDGTFEAPLCRISRPQP